MAVNRLHSKPAFRTLQNGFQHCQEVSSLSIDAPALAAKECRGFSEMAEVLRPLGGLSRRSLERDFSHLSRGSCSSVETVRGTSSSRCGRVNQFITPFLSAVE